MYVYQFFHDCFKKRLFQTERVSFVCLIKKKKKSDVVNSALNAEWAAAIIITPTS